MNDNFYIVGKNSVLDAVKNNYPIQEIYVNNINKIINEFRNCRVMNKDFFDKFSNMNHQGYIAKIKPPSIYELSIINKEKPSKILILDHIQDVGNFGAILRSANAFNFNYIIFPKDRCAKLTPQVLKISSGGFTNMKFIQVSNIASTLNYLKDEGYWIYASGFGEKSISLEKVNFNNQIALVIGNEEKGCSVPVIKNADVLVNVNMYGSVQSLNASVATGILMYEITRRKHN
ncbi:23S rRNA (guanosine(2251)-2'-O)-methyltransferase RlmB [Mycoplasma elephantis]|uniref:23S rRNA (guanosine(2251)-2'-O)-methyltransferase RlmB n=1 Tax=Mycoplasma elephantis TaxID=114882 RepID=UPI000483C190|nr:23S rRNA (guanosine(2251)-2'-O)-methyltransferase RlmB [Mycoplasma elephantis]